MPGESRTFTRASDPISPPKIRTGKSGIMVEAPGTAPGSASFIAKDVYHHSRANPALYI